MSEQNERKDLAAVLAAAPATGAQLTVQRARLKSLSKKEIIGTAAHHGWAYVREEIEGDEWRLIFRRDPAVATRAEQECPVTDWRVQLQQVEPDLRGMVEIDLSQFGPWVPKADQAQIVQTAAAYGWESHGYVVRDRTMYWRFARRGATPVKGFDDQFIAGPSLAELRRSEAAKHEAERVCRDTGVDVLSEAALDGMRSAHVSLRRRMVRFAWLGVLPAIVLLVMALYIPNRLIHDDPETAGVLGIVAAVAALGFVVPLILAIRLNRKRKAATRGYLDGYKRVVRAALHPGERG